LDIIEVDNSQFEPLL